MTHRRILRAVLVPLIVAAVPFVGCRQVIGIDEPVACTSDDACNTADNPCVAGECVEGYCAYALRAEGTVVDTAGEQDCQSHVCDANGAVVVAVAPDDAPADETPGDCVSPACDDQGNVVSAPNDADTPTSGDTPGDCMKAGCVDGAPADIADDTDAPVDDVLGDCESPACDAGQVVTVPNTMDTPAQDIDGDCLAPTCDANGALAIDDNDTPTSGCGSCSNGVVVPWAELNTGCYTGMTGTQNVGVCIGGTWACTDNVKECVGEITPAQEQCGGGFSGMDEDCDGATDEDGPGCNCQLGMTQACYGGSAATRNVGTCMDGVSTCMSTMSGNQYGGCVGDVLPQACDSCILVGDQDCSGTAEACTGAHVWSKAFGNATSDIGIDVAQLVDGTVMALGTFSGSLTANNTVTSDGLTDVLLLRLDQDGNAINARDYGGTGNDGAVAVVPMSDGGYMLGGTLGDGSSETFGSGAALTGVGQDGFIAKFNSNHTLAWKKLLGGTSNDKVTGVARMPDNGVVVVGQFQGTMNLGGSNLTSLGFDDIFVARFDASGNHVWSKRFGDVMQNNVTGVAVAPNGDVVFVGDFGTSANFGGPTFANQGGIDGYIARLDQNGNHVWTRAFQSSGNEYATRVGTTSDGSVWVAGSFDTAVNVDGVAGADVSPTSTGTDLLLVKYGPTGNYLVGKGINGTGSTTVRSLSVGFDDGVVVSGYYTGTLFFGMISAPAVGGADAFIFKIGTSGQVLWSRKPGDTGADTIYGVNVGQCGDVFAIGYFANNVNFGGGDLPNQGGLDIAVAKYRQ